MDGSPPSQQGYSCYYEFAATTSQWKETARHLKAALAKSPDDPRLQMALGENRAATGDLEAMHESFQLALTGFLRGDNPQGQAAARIGLADYYQRIGSFEDASQQLELAESALTTTEDRLALVDIELARAWLAFRRGDFSQASTKLGVAQRLHRDISDAGQPESRHQLRRESRLSNALGAIDWALQRPEGAIKAYRREAELLQRLGDSYDASTPLYNLALVAASHRRRLGLQVSDVRKRTEQALSAALRVGHLKNEMTSRLLLANLLAAEIQQSGGRNYLPAIQQAETALDLGRKLRDEPTRNRAVQSLARFYHSQEPDKVGKSLQLFDAVLASATERQSLAEIAFAHYYRFDVLWHAGMPEPAQHSALKALDAIERMRDLQSDSTTRARIFSAWAERYREIYDWLVKPQEGGSDRRSLELAVSVIERMRARELLSDLDRASATARLIPEGETADRRSAILGQISGLQGRLLTEELSDSERSKLIDGLDDLEIDLRQAEETLGRENQKYRLLRAPDFATLEDVQRALDQDEVVLSFQVLAASGSVLRITANSVESFSVPGRYKLAGQLEFLAGLIGRRDGSEASGVELLSRDLVSDALGDLPVSIDRLIIVPDGGLGKLPFSALATGPSGPRLPQRYDIIVSPSLTTWLFWRNARHKPLLRQLLALADPILPIQERDGGRPPASERAWSLAERLSLGGLPRARSEGRSAIRSVAGNGKLALGRNASERFIKEANLGNYAIIHFAAHALVDEANPERTALLLAPGADSEDGLLQVREIVNLDLDGQLVVLSACQSASGEVLSGEGVLSLARAFFTSGAHAVVGTLWPLRDDDAAAFFQRFYQHLGEGANAAAALASAQRDRIAEGAPTAAWAGFVVLGNGDVTPFPGGAPRNWSWWRWALLLGALIGGGLAIRRVILR